MEKYYSREGKIVSKEDWIDSYQALGNAITRLEEVIILPVDEGKIHIDASIQRFEFCIELFWKVLKKRLREEGIQSTTPKQTLQKAFAVGWIDDDQLWINMLNDRNETSHTYDEFLAKEIYERIKSYAPKLREVYGSL